MLAYLILVHRYPQQFKRLFKAIYHQDNHYLVHVDKKSEDSLHAEVQAFLAGYPNASVLESQRVLWGGFSLVDVELRGIRELMKRRWDFFINLSGQDFPLQSQEAIAHALSQTRATDYLVLRGHRPETLYRITNHVVEHQGRLISVAKRPFLSNAIPYIGNQWAILSRDFCDFVTNSHEVDRFRDFYENTFIPDEGFFQTILMNTSYKGSSIVNDDMREISWISLSQKVVGITANGVLVHSTRGPRVLTSEDASRLLASKNFFARKFDETVDSDILGTLESKVLT